MQQNCKHSRGRCCLLQWFTEHKMLGQHAQAICALKEHFGTVMHVQHKTGTSDKQGQRAKGILKDLQSEKFLKYLNFMTDVTNVLSTLRKTFHSDQLRVCSTRSSKRATVKKQVFFRRNHWATSRSLIPEKCPWSILIRHHMAIVMSSHWLSISAITILQKRRRQALSPCGLLCLQG